MNLLDPVNPFSQTVGLHQRFAGYETPIDELEVVRARWGGARELFQHRPEDLRPRFAPARAARALLAYQAFTTGGLVKKPSEPTSATAAPLARSALVVVRGASLFVTLVSNLLVYNDMEPFPTGGATDACAWEQDLPPTALPLAQEPRRRPHGYLDLLTWQSRRVQLVEDAGDITHFINAVYQGVADDSSPDPMVAYRRDEKRGWVPLSIDVNRAFWRDAGALFETMRAESAAYLRPRAIDQLGSIEAFEVFGTDAMYDVEVLGQHAEQSKVLAVRIERVQTRGRSFNDPDAGSAVREALRMASEFVRVLLDAVRLYARIALAPDGRDPDVGAVSALADATGARVAAWSALGLGFETFMRELSADPLAAVEGFKRRGREVTRVVFQEATSRADTSGRWLQAQASAEQRFNRELAELSNRAIAAGAVGVPAR